jgi:hypothetical protein
MFVMPDSVDVTCYGGDVVLKWISGSIFVGYSVNRMLYKIIIAISRYL